MTIEEMQALRDATEKVIQDALNNFSNKTGCAIHSVKHIQYRCSSQEFSSVFDIEVRL